MKILLKDFIGVKKEFIDFYKKRGIKDVGYFCASAGLPVAVAMCFILEIEPENEEAKKIKDRVVRFYGYTEII